MSIKRFVWIPVIVFVASVGIFVNYGMASIRFAETTHGLSNSALQLKKANSELKQCIANIDELVRRVFGMERLISKEEIDREYKIRTHCLEPATSRMNALLKIHQNLGGQGEGLVIEVRALTDSWLLEAERVLGLTASSSILTPHAFDLLSDNIDDSLESLESEVERVPALISRQNEMQVASLYRILFLTLLVFTVFMTYVIFSIRRFVSDIDHLARAMKELCRGNTAIDVPIDESQGELARVATGIVAFREALIKVIKGEERYAHLANHDPLTNVFNRRRFMEVVESLIGENEGASLVVLKIDLDKFKQVNDSYGHAAGDAVLVDTVDIMQASLREGDVLARLGGDEFVVVLTGPDGQHTWSTVVDRILMSVEEPARISGLTIDRGLSIGVSVYPDDGRTIDELLVSADIALYEAKARGKGCSVRVNATMIATNLARMKLIEELEYAVERREFAAYFQPKIASTTNEIVGFEALARWNHAERGVIGPFHFIEVAETSDLIVRIGELVLLEAIRAIRLLKEAGLESDISVNASARELSKASYADTFMDTLRAHDVEASAVSVELLETVALEFSNEEISKNLIRLNESGVLTWIDDFGVGYSTVGVLQHGFIHGIKIDRRFVCTSDSGEAQRTLLKTIVQMAKGLDKRCILEGVETEAEMHYARDIGCEVIQGYYHAKPMPLEELIPWWLERGRDGEKEDRAA